jgi:hypothetical protein
MTPIYVCSLRGSDAGIIGAAHLALLAFEEHASGDVTKTKKSREE